MAVFLFDTWNTHTRKTAFKKMLSFTTKTLNDIFFVCIFSRFSIVQLNFNMKRINIPPFENNSSSRTKIFVAMTMALRNTRWERRKAHFFSNFHVASIFHSLFYSLIFSMSPTLSLFLPTTLLFPLLLSPPFSLPYIINRRVASLTVDNS